jgi:prepilin peptidase CpaA
MPADCWVNQTLTQQDPQESHFAAKTCPIRLARFKQTRAVARQHFCPSSLLKSSQRAIRHILHSFKFRSSFMFGTALLPYAALLAPLAAIITYYDVKYRRIPNAFVIATLICGLLVNTFFLGLSGTFSSVAGFVLGFVLMLMLHVFGAMGAGDVKLFAAVSSVMGMDMVLPTFLIVLLTGGILAFISTLRAGSLKTTLFRSLQILVGLLPGWEMPRFAVPTDRRLTIPYGVAITFGSLISLAIFRV